MRTAIASLFVLLVATASFSEASADEDILHNYLKFQLEANKVQETPQESLVQEEAKKDDKDFRKFPSWVETEDDLEAYLKQQGTKVVRKNTATHLAIAPKRAATSVQQGAPAPSTEFVDLPHWVHTEADMEKFFKQHGAKVVRRGTEHKEKTVQGPVDDGADKAAPEMTLVQGLDPLEEADRADILKGLKEAQEEEDNKDDTPYVPSLVGRLAALDSKVEEDGAESKFKEEMSYDDDSDDRDD